MLRADLAALCIAERELLPIEVLHCEKRIGIFDILGSCDLDPKLDP